MRTGAALFTSIFVMLLLSMGSPRPVWAHQETDRVVPSLGALRIDSPVTLDGILDEPFWEQAEVATNFINTRTGEPEAQQTKARVAYTRTHLYIAVECF
jgi:hypothetical protein